MKRACTNFLFLLVSLVLLSQVPQSFNYQAVIRNSGGSIVADQQVGIKISILQTSTTGTAVYVETFAPMTNSLGLINLEIGNGTILSGDFSSIDWANNLYFLKIEIDPTGGSSYAHIGTSQLLSVPYALHASTVENDMVNDADPDPVNEIQTLKLDDKTLHISDGNSVELIGDANLWSENGGEIYYNSGNVGIGTNNPAYDLDIIDPTGEAYTRIRSNNASSSLILDKYSVSHIGQVVYQQNHVNKFHTGLLGNNNYRISTDRFSLVGLEVKETGDVEFSDGIKIGVGAGEGKVLTSDASGNASWQGPNTKYLSIPGMGFHNYRQVEEPTSHYHGLVHARTDNQTHNVTVSFPVLLPHGAVITGVSISVFDNTDHNFTIDLDYNEFNTTNTHPPNPTRIVRIQSSGSELGDRTFTADLSGIDPNVLTIDHGRVYYLEATWLQAQYVYELYMSLERVLITYIE